MCVLCEGACVFLVRLPGLALAAYTWAATFGWAGKAKALIVGELKSVDLQSMVRKVYGNDLGAFTRENCQ